MRNQSQNRDNEKRYRINAQIRISPVILINDEGRNMGSVPLQKAMDIASLAGLDLVEIAPNSRPPVCRVMDFGKFKFEQTIKEKKQKKKHKANQVKEIHLSPSIQSHDIETKIKAARKFLDSGHRVSVRLEFRRRELAHRELGDTVMAHFTSSLNEVAEVVSPPKSEGKSLVCVLAPKGSEKAS